MKEFKFNWGLLIVSIAVFCLGIYLTICSSLWFIILDLVSFCWITQIIVLNIKWCDTLKANECAKISKRLNIYGYFFLIAGFANAILSLSRHYPDITNIIGLFCLCCFVLAMFFSSIIKHKNQKDDGNWTEKTNRVLAKQILQIHIQRWTWTLSEGLHKLKWNLWNLDKRKSI